MTTVGTVSFIIHKLFIYSTPLFWWSYGVSRLYLWLEINTLHFIESIHRRFLIFCSGRNIVTGCSLW
jgi:hypothetical protein